MNIRLIWIVIGVLGIALVGSVYFVLTNQENTPTTPPISQNEPRCLKDNEYAEYWVNKENPEDRIARIYVRDKVTNEIIKEFEIEIITPQHYHPIEIRKCHVYVSRSFNYDYQKRMPLDNYRAEIWRYDYQGSGEAILLLGKMLNGEYMASGFSDDYRVSTDEQYISLQKEYLGHPEHALVIRSVGNPKDIFVLTIAQTVATKFEYIGSIGFEEGGWTQDGRYFWFDLFNGANVSAYVRIERDTWNWALFPAPENTMGGDKLNLKTGWVTHNTLGVWTGENIISQQIKEEYQREGKTGIFALYNLFTKEEIILETATDPTYFYKPLWLSDSELQYELPNGTKKIYRLK